MTEEVREGAQMTTKTTALATIKVGGREYPAVSERLCRTCSSPLRRLVEEKVVEGLTWTQIARLLPADCGLTARNIRDHITNDHLSIRAEAVQRLAERQAHDRGELVERAVEPVVEHLSFCQAVVGRVARRIAQGDLEPSIKDAVMAASVLARHQPPTPQVDEGAYLQGFILIQEEAQRFMGNETYLQFAMALNRNPQLWQLARQWSERNPNTDPGPRPTGGAGN